MHHKSSYCHSAPIRRVLNGIPLFIILAILIGMIIPARQQAIAGPLLQGNGSGGASSSKQTPVATATTVRTSQPNPAKGFTVEPVATVTPQADGSIIHVVQPGEVLLNIALAYNVKLSDLYKLNNLDEKSVIYPGEEIKIKGPDPTATFTETPTVTDIPTATRRPTRTPTPTPTITPTSLAVTPSPTLSVAPPSRGPDPLLIAIGVLLVVGVGFVVAGTLLRK